jgi:hypothetical protein
MRLKTVGTVKQAEKAAARAAKANSKKVAERQKTGTGPMKKLLLATAFAAAAFASPAAAEPIETCTGRVTGPAN